MSLDLVHYADLLGQIKLRIRQGQSRAVLSANAEMITTYWDVGKILHERQLQEGWGRAVIPRLSRDLRNELPEVKGFSERNIGYMIRLVREYGFTPILQQPVAKLDASEKVPQSVAQMVPSAILPQLVAKIPWGHNILLMEKVKDLTARLWYMQQVVEHGYVRDTLLSMIKNNSYERHGKAINNFDVHLPPAQVVDDRLRHPDDNQTIGLILCQDRKTVLAEYALRGIEKPIGISEYELTRALPESLKSALPSIEEIERELSEADADSAAKRSGKTKANP